MKKHFGRDPRFVTPDSSYRFFDNRCRRPYSRTEVAAASIIFGALVALGFFLNL